MQHIKKMSKRNSILLVILGMLLGCIMYVTVVQASEVIEPTSDQYLELRAVQVIENEDGNNQLIMELWGNELEFKGVDFRISYDSTKVNPSNLSTNEVTANKDLYFQFEEEFKDCLELFTYSYDGEGTGISGTIAFNPPVAESEHIIEKEGVGKVVNTYGGVLLGKMSFQMTGNSFDSSWFKLEESETISPATGVKINIDGINCYINQSTFRFTDKTASNDATLNNLIVSSGKVNEETPEKSTYKEYTLTPTFNKETFNYSLELLEYIDTVSIKATTNHEKATMKIKIPKRDEQGQLVYDTDRITILYEEKEIQSDVPLELILNKLGELDTNITITVTAEDGETINTYELAIKRPYGIIKGSIYTSPTVLTTGIHKATIRIYDSDEANKAINWNTVQTGVTDDVHDKLLALDSRNYETEDDGAYEIYVIPGKYDILIDKTGYLDQIYITKQVQEGEVLDLGYKELIAGDINKDGCIQILDLSLLMTVFGITNTDSNYNIKYDFNEDLEIQILDLSTMMANFSRSRSIE